MPALFGLKSPRRIITNPTFVSAGTSAHGNSATPGLPAGYQNNDIFIAVMGISSSGNGPAAPSGWTKLNNVTRVGDTSFNIVLYWRRSTSSETAPTFTAVGGDATYQLVVKIYAFRGCITSGNPYNVINTGDPDFTSPPLHWYNPSITTTIDKCLIVGSIAYRNSAWTSVTNSNLTGIVLDNFSTTDNNGVGAGVFYANQATSGATGQSYFAGTVGSSYSFITQGVLALIPAS